MVNKYPEAMNFPTRARDELRALCIKLRQVYVMMIGPVGLGYFWPALNSLIQVSWN